MPKRKAKPAPRYAEQPAVAAMLKLLRSRRGATVAEIAKARGLQPHTVRSVLNRLGSRRGSCSSGRRSRAEVGWCIAFRPSRPDLSDEHEPAAAGLGESSPSGPIWTVDGALQGAVYRACRRPHCC
jgi:Protein of unknown function (DUF3489)